LNPRAGGRGKENVFAWWLVFLFKFERKENEAHLRGLLRDYISYYHADRIHNSLEKDAPAMRLVSSQPSQSARLVSFPRIGGLHHRYDGQKAA
jgi:hypothetical protein